MDPDISKLVKRTEKESKYVIIDLFSMENLVWSLQINWEMKKKKGSHNTFSLSLNPKPILNQKLQKNLKKSLNQSNHKFNFLIHHNLHRNLR